MNLRRSRETVVFGAHPTSYPAARARTVRVLRPFGVPAARRRPLAVDVRLPDMGDSPASERCDAG